jgi:two-component system, NarL family, sensor kinase
VRWRKDQGRSGGTSSSSATTRRALVRFVLVSLLVAVAVGAVGAEAGRRAARNESIQDARRLTQVLARNVIEPNATPDLLVGNPAAVAHLDQVVPRLVSAENLVRVKIWTPSGRIVYSDEHRLIGSTYVLGGDEIEAIVDRKVDAELSDLTAPENRFERGQGRMLEVYLPILTSDRQVLLLETYSRYQDVVSAPAGSVWRDFLPITFAALALLQLLQLPLVWGTARRLDSSVQERERLARDAAEASATERRRIAADLHDSVVQDLAAVSYSLSGAAERLSAPEVERRPIRSAAATVRRSIQSLRTLLVEIYPDSLQNEGLQSALTDLSAQLVGQGVDVRLDLSGDIDVPRASNELIFRVAAEALRNVAEHAHATHVALSLCRVSGGVELTVTDDGRGFDPDDLRNGPEAGHLGLALLRDRAARDGGKLQITSTSGRGTTVLLLIPVEEAT